MQISFAVTAKLISAFVFATRIVQSLYFLNPKFQASNHLLWLYSPVCVGPGRKPRRPVFAQRGSYHFKDIVCDIGKQCKPSSNVESVQSLNYLLIQWGITPKCEKTLTRKKIWFSYFLIMNPCIKFQDIQNIQVKIMKIA